MCLVPMVGSFLTIGQMSIKRHECNGPADVHQWVCAKEHAPSKSHSKDENDEARNAFFNQLFHFYSVLSGGDSEVTLLLYYVPIDLVNHSRSRKTPTYVGVFRDLE